jgi:hypothetical protein
MPGSRGQVDVALAESFPDPVEREAILRQSYGDNASQLLGKWRDFVSAPAAI